MAGYCEHTSKPLDAISHVSLTWQILGSLQEGCFMVTVSKTQA